MTMSHIDSHKFTVFHKRRAVRNPEISFQRSGMCFINAAAIHKYNFHDKQGVILYQPIFDDDYIHFAFTLTDEKGDKNLSWNRDRYVTSFCVYSLMTAFKILITRPVRYYLQYDPNGMDGRGLCYARLTSVMLDDGRGYRVLTM